MIPRARALEIVTQLQSAGFTALFAGGCVRDRLLGKKPKDYDVATSATPDQVQEVFGHQQTLAIGKSFGVITVLGPKSAGPVEVATFRRDGDYSDGRRPDSVEFTDAKEDALRRDFTINGMFFDPVAETVIDYVGGQQDLEAKRICAIGDAGQRIEEDKLRMLRAVRFASTYGFSIEAETLKAIQENAAEISAVSPERIGGEIRRMMGHREKANAFGLLVKSGLWQEICHEVNFGAADLEEVRAILGRLQSDDFATVIAAIHFDQFKRVSQLKDAWRLTNDETAKANWLLKSTPALTDADRLAWSQLQPLLVSPHASDAVGLLVALDESKFGDAIARCQECLGWPEEKLNPPALIDGKALTVAGISPGPQFKNLIQTVRDLQLDGEINSAEQAISWAVEQAAIRPEDSSNNNSV